MRQDKKDARLAEKRTNQARSIARRAVRNWKRKAVVPFPEYLLAATAKLSRPRPLLRKATLLALIAVSKAGIFAKDTAVTFAAEQVQRPARAATARERVSSRSTEAMLAPFATEWAHRSAPTAMAPERNFIDNRISEY